MEIAENRVITITYEVRQDGPRGTLLERMDTNHPFQALFGRGKMLPAWEKELEGLKPGEAFRFLLKPAAAYGEVSQAHILKMPIALFLNEAEQINPELLQKDQYITLTDSNGQAVHGKIISWNEKEVQVDCNHALAGKSLFFTGTVLNVREATIDELIQGGPSSTNN